MDDKTFNQIIETKLEETHKVLLAKNAGYANEDRLHVFTTATALGPEGENRSQVLAGMMKKHTVSVYDMINSGEAYSEEMWDEKIGDHINYLLLLRATIVEDALIKLIEEPEPLAEWEKALLKYPKIVWDAKDKIEVTLTHDEELMYDLRQALMSEPREDTVEFILTLRQNGGVHKLLTDVYAREGRTDVYSNDASEPKMKTKDARVKLVKESDEAALDALREKLLVPDPKPNEHWFDATEEERDVYFSDNAESGENFVARRSRFVSDGDKRWLKERDE